MSDELPLDEEQRAAVEAPEPAIAVLAGPGSGKTRVLSYRARQLLSTDSDSRALLLTFTNKAAAEMKSRALGVTVVTTDRINASTFHNFSMRLLRAHGELVGLSPDFEILDDDERRALTVEIGTGDRPERLFARWSYLRLRRLEAREARIVEFGEAYERRKRAENVVDFDDLVVYAANLLGENPLLAEAMGAAYPHVLIDEFQDTNPAQFAIVQALCEYVKTVSVFADDDQGIYQFAGAEPANIRRFIEQLDAVRYPLTTNYRCREAIVVRANRLIAADSTASGRQMTAHYSGGEVSHRSFRTIGDEAETLAGEICELIETRDAVPAGVAILGRRRTRLEHFIPALERKGVPVSNWLGPTFESEERQALATSLYVARGTLAPRQLRRLCEFVDEEPSEERNVETLLEDLPDTPVVRHLRELRELIWGGADMPAVVAKASEAVLVRNPGYLPSLARIGEAVTAFESHDPDFGLDHLLAELALGGVHGAPTEGGGVKVSTLHRAKGLQWPRVYLVGLEDGMLPDFRADTPLSMKEERRTCFVGVCRAEMHLTLCHIRVDGTWARQPSIFIREMGFSPGE